MELVIPVPRARLSPHAELLARLRTLSWHVVWESGARGECASLGCVCVLEDKKHVVDARSEICLVRCLGFIRA